MKADIEKEACRVFGPGATVGFGAAGTRHHASAGVPNEVGGRALVILGEPTPHDAELALLEALQGRRSLGPAPTWWNRAIGWLTGKALGRHGGGSH